MIPQISRVSPFIKLIFLFLKSLKKEGFTGDIATNYSDRLSLSTDNSIYQLIPDAILFPRSTYDVILIFKLASKSEFSNLIFTPRGGGTGTNGQALNKGIVVDISRYMNNILDINIEQCWVNVEAGVIKDQLNLWLKPYGFFFSPELSTSNRATIGGMINTDASGQGSLVYGKTSDHVKELVAVLLGGHILNTRPMSIELAEQIANNPTTEGFIYYQVLTSCRKQRSIILKKFPKLNRFLTGYDLQHVFSDDMKTFDLTRLLCGSEGTLAFITEARLNITPIPKVRRLVNIKYDSFNSALHNASFLVDAKALSVETIDSKVLDLAHKDIIWDSVKELISDIPNKKIQGLNIVEFAGNNNEQIELQINILCKYLDKFIALQQNGVIGYQICNDINKIELIYNMRKKAVGLLGNSINQAKPIPFIEDTVVPPERLANYITELRLLLDSYGLDYGMFGHIDAGVLHLRPVLDMCDLRQEALIKQISDKVVILTEQYGGLLWGEHGKGFRSQYNIHVFGEILFNELRCIKTAFDPDNRMNPGKICTPLNNNNPMIQIDAIKRGTYDRQIPITVREKWNTVMNCNGNGLCFTFDLQTIMCPSMKITRNRTHSPKGRASLMREWLRLLSEQNCDINYLEKKLLPNKNINLDLYKFIKRIWNSWNAKRGTYDFSHEIKDAMVSCLACKACSTQCPIKIDVPSFRSRFLQLYYTRYLRPMMDYLIAMVEQYIPLIAKSPRVFNFFLEQPWICSLIRKHIGLVDLPLLSIPSLKQYIKYNTSINLNLKQIKIIKNIQFDHCVLVVQDLFTSYYEAKLVRDFLLLIKKLGYHPILLPFYPNGKSQHVKGFLNHFANTVKKTSYFLNNIAKLNIPMVGIDPAMVLCYRDEYKQILDNKLIEFKVLMVHEWLHKVLTKFMVYSNNNETWYLFTHCIESTILPASPHQWKDIFSFFRTTLKHINVGCCGMAGTYGHEIDNLNNSIGIYKLSWHSQLNKLPFQRCLATGFSCRSQIKRIEGKTILHPLQALLKIISTSCSSNLQGRLQLL
ncbi:FAD-binding and (Fe-S)-binding domain-containing protein [Pantoea sp. Aalb]|uniref:D-2-hydroxyglutarate dehydrogenase YdiJ n=1 Tax=Pantoea sp. Aalb TaxID=2576762 RepID=UPI0013218D87|nr:FAD-binding and (Fe-S)-binding domain-containing protein [Pantoea sp. Aalb]MXP67430.1 FAD-binding oxidoreductase [Pantoea sp. Aalb]